MDPMGYDGSTENPLLDIRVGQVMQTAEQEVPEVTESLKSDGSRGICVGGLVMGLSDGLSIEKKWVNRWL